MKGLYKIADLYVLIEYRYNYTKKFLENYLSTDNALPDIVLTVLDSDLEYELNFAEIKILDVVESSCILRKLAYEITTKFSGVLFHASSIAYNNKAFMFTAKSGTGKSTHTRNLKTVYGDKITYINDDKPIIRYFASEDKFYVYGSPWNGKHMLSNNIKVPLEAVIKLNRGDINKVEKESSLNALNFLLEQTYSTNDKEMAVKRLDVITKMLEKVKFYSLTCTKDESSSSITYTKVLNGGIYEDK